MFLIAGSPPSFPLAARRGTRVPRNKEHFGNGNVGSVSYCGVPSFPPLRNSGGTRGPRNKEHFGNGNIGSVPYCRVPSFLPPCSCEGGKKGDPAIRNILEMDMLEMSFITGSFPSQLPLATAINRVSTGKSA